MNNKIVIGLVLGLVLGAIDGATAWFYPEARPGLAGIMVGSSIKGMLVGLAAGWFARKVKSTAWGITVGGGVALLLAFGVASMATVGDRHPYLEIMMPGFIVGLIVGFVTQRAGAPPERAKSQGV